MARNKTDTINKIIQNVIDIGAEDGIKAVTTQSIAKRCGIVEGTIFLHFGTISNLLSQAFLKVDEKKAKSLVDIGLDVFDEKDDAKLVRIIWDSYLDFWLDNPNIAKYYMNFFRSSHYHYQEHTIIEAEYVQFKERMERMTELTEAYEKIGYVHIWQYIINNTIDFAIKMSDGQIECNEEKKDFIFKLIFSKFI